MKLILLILFLVWSKTKYAKLPIKCDIVILLLMREYFSYLEPIMIRLHINKTFTFLGTANYSPFTKPPLPRRFAVRTSCAKAELPRISQWASEFFPLDWNPGVHDIQVSLFPLRTHNLFSSLSAPLGTKSCANRESERGPNFARPRLEWNKGNSADLKTTLLEGPTRHGEKAVSIPPHELGNILNFP